MYLPSRFAEKNKRKLVDFMRSEPFATVVTTMEGTPFATHIPMLVHEEPDGAILLCGHIARANPQWRSFAQSEALVIFRGPHGYISPSWYDVPSRGVPTWNYAAAQCRGEAIIVDKSRSREILQQLTETMESTFENPWTLQSADPKYIDSRSKEIIAFELLVNRVEGKFKYSQNRSEPERERIMERLSAAPNESARELGRRMFEYYREL